MRRPRSWLKLQQQIAEAQAAQEANAKAQEELESALANASSEAERAKLLAEQERLKKEAAELEAATAAAQADAAAADEWKEEASQEVDQEEGFERRQRQALGSSPLERHQEAQEEDQPRRRRRSAWLILPPQPVVGPRKTFQRPELVHMAPALRGPVCFLCPHSRRWKRSHDVCDCAEAGHMAPACGGLFALRRCCGRSKRSQDV